MNVCKAAVAAGVPTIVLGCATAHPIGPLDTSSSGYRDPSFRDAELKESGLAVLPVTGDRPGDAVLAGQVGPRVVVAIEKRYVCAVVLPPADVTERFARDGVSERFARMLAELPQRGALDRETLDAMARSTGCRYFLQASVRSGSSYDVAPVDGVPHGSRAVTADLFAQLWDASTGEVVWEGIGGGAALTNPPHGGTTDQALALAIAGVASLLGRDPASLPPPPVVADLHDRDHSQIASVNGENAARAEAASTGLQFAVVMLQIAGAIADLAD